MMTLFLLKQLSGIQPLLIISSLLHLFIFIIQCLFSLVFFFFFTAGYSSGVFPRG